MSSTRDAWMRTVESNDLDGGLVLHCVFLPMDEARSVRADGQGEFLR